MAATFRCRTEKASETTGLLISILMRYPEVASVNYDPEKQMLKFTFLCSKILEGKEIELLKEMILDAVGVYNSLEDKEAGNIFFEHYVYGDTTVIELQRDVCTLIGEEITLIVGLLRQFLGKNLLVEESNLLGEDLVEQDEVINYVLENIRLPKHEKQLVAFREEGRVLVFNK